MAGNLVEMWLTSSMTGVCLCVCSSWPLADVDGSRVIDGN